ncbi:hypothetical protein GOP47_0023907 [Adiantum capillus-veneris]|uniref:Uncharacterized protein n=1 Tax=Adiantum capillus-veneris TaxID=13818 RepID=A0A9D4Z5L4_ADICA|nr:hypothetical protein GOP47_0023907 [Adiantum capillus-veneris]
MASGEHYNIQQQQGAVRCTLMCRIEPGDEIWGVIVGNQFDYEGLVIKLRDGEHSAVLMMQAQRLEQSGNGQGASERQAMAA